MIVPLPLDVYGVATCRGATREETWRKFGYTLAVQRPVQMEMARRQAWGSLAQVQGASAAAADEEVLRSRYPKSEIERQFYALPPDMRSLWHAYADGVTQGWRTQTARFSETGLPAPQAWTATDSMAISIRLLQYFGRGGAGELRNMGVLAYLRAQPALKGRELDVIDDLAFREAIDAPTTMGGKTKARFPKAPSRAETLAHLAKLPRMNLLELLPGLRLYERTQDRLIAQRLGTPDRTGSYAIVHHPGRGGAPVLLSAPQMGFAVPGIVHPIRLEAPGLAVEGMSVPGIPTVLIGATPRIAWGITSGVADTEDVVMTNATDVAEDRVMEIKGGGTRTVPYRALGRAAQVLKSGETTFVRRSSFAGEEWRSLVAVQRVLDAYDGRSAERSVDGATLSFNFFYATARDAGWRYLGAVDTRTDRSDSRFPALSMRAYQRVPEAKMPSRKMWGKAGTLVNWNDKPAVGWVNGDTPVWGEIWRSREIWRALPKNPQADDLMRVAKTISERDENWEAFAPYARKVLPALAMWSGLKEAGDTRPGLFASFLSELRKEIFTPSVGGFTNPQLFELVLQPSVVLRALEGRTKFDYRQGRSINALITAAASRAKASPYVPSAIPMGAGEPPVPSRNRGTYIQVVTMGPNGAVGGNVMTPGPTEAGEFARSFGPLAREWRLRPFSLPRPTSSGR